MADMKLVDLGEVREDPSTKGVVDMLRRVADEVEAGKLNARSVVIVTVDALSSVMEQFDFGIYTHGIRDLQTMGLLDVVKFVLVKRCAADVELEDAP